MCNELTPWSTVVLGNVVFAPFVMKFLTFHESEGSSPLGSILGRLNPVHIPTPRCCKIHFYIEICFTHDGEDIGTGFWVVTPCGIVDRLQLLNPEHGVSTFLRNISIYLQLRTTLQLRSTTSILFNIILHSTCSSFKCFFFLQ